MVLSTFKVHKESYNLFENLRDIKKKRTLSNKIYPWWSSHSVIVAL